jgi:hypothetical protein
VYACILKKTPFRHNSQQLAYVAEWLRRWT